ncbi:hypothetical protein RhiirC2_864261 [Rhizophagus irregularis]|uniref:Uncharacterized protein n=1 Tax=Rhizophagus irregularis TaxID=588596 RepID=A0A2N1NIP8_9GLOM|nr:hypothetical protein RhiirC2_864261 [Rhizophagus irregularis]
MVDIVVDGVLKSQKNFFLKTGRFVTVQLVCLFSPPFIITNMSNEEPLNPCQPTKAIVHLYRPAKVHMFHFAIRKLNPYICCNTRGNGKLYNSSIGHYYMLDTNYRADHPNTDDKLYRIYTNDIELSQEHCRTFGSTSKIANLNYLIGNYPCFHLACGYDNCPRPAASVYNRDHWRCNRHYRAIALDHPINPLTSVKTSIKSPSVTINTAAPKHDPKFHCNESTIGVSKEVHSQRLGISNTVTIQKYNRHYKPQNARLQHSMTPVTNINLKKRVTSEYRYFKEYSRLTFDIHRSPKQIERWKRLTTSVLRHEHNGISFKNKPFLLNEDKNNSKPYVVFKQIYHLPKRTPDNIGYIEQCDNRANTKLF